MSNFSWFIFISFPHPWLAVTRHISSWKLEANPNMNKYHRAIYWTKVFSYIAGWNTVKFRKHLGLIQPIWWRLPLILNGWYGQFEMMRFLQRVAFTTIIEIGKSYLQPLANPVCEFYVAQFASNEVLVYSVNFVHCGDDIWNNYKSSKMRNIKIPLTYQVFFPIIYFGALKKFTSLSMIWLFHFRCWNVHLTRPFD